MANHLDIGHLAVKDESQRFDLNAFKVLGASFAIAKHLAALIGLAEDELTFDAVVSHREVYRDVTFVTATDGNHGRAVAWSAQLFGCRSVVYMPKGTAPARLDAIRSYGAEASITLLTYDEAVLYAERQSHSEGWVLLQDTSGETYEQVPLDIMHGYATLVTEVIRQHVDPPLTHVFLQAGVGSMAAAVIAFMHRYRPSSIPTFVIVEPEGAPCLYESGKTAAGTITTIEGDLPTIMAGLACGTPSLIAWDILSRSANAFLRCADRVAIRGMRVLGQPQSGDLPITSGESGAVTLGALLEILTDQKYQHIRDDLGLNSHSSVLLFSTEGDTDPQFYCTVLEP
ncbi:MAG: diaminopropionate ammonia-lyase [Rhodothermales bacterium]